MKILDVPFIANPDNRCVPATTGMILAYFMPEKTYTKYYIKTPKCP